MRIFLFCIIFWNINFVICQENQQFYFHISLRETPLFGRKALENVKIEVITNDKEIATFFTDSTGQFSMLITIPNSYHIRINKVGYIEKRVNMNTTAVPGYVQNLKNKHLGIALHRLSEDKKISFFDKFTSFDYNYDTIKEDLVSDLKYLDSYYEKLELEEQDAQIEKMTKNQLDLELNKLRLSNILNLEFKNKKLKAIELQKNKLELKQKEQERKLNVLSLKQKNKDILVLNKDKKNKEANLKSKNKIISQQKTITYFILIASSFILLLLVFSVFAFLQKKKQKKEIELAHFELAHKNREILDSITYAKRIQSAILPQPKLVKEFLEDSFVLYKPKDIVAGDFYWLEVVGDTVLFAAADCTGHGVPGAMVSVVCNNGLNRAVREYGLKEPNEILDKTRDLVVEEFEKSDEEVKDGMDISLCALDTKTNKLKWSGANNPLWILSKNKEGQLEILETKADKQPIGKYANPKAFSLNEYQLAKDDIIYIFTDGYQDQFGGAKEKKFRAAKMKELFILLADKKMEEQRKVIDQTFEDWKGELEQVDDVCVIGVRI